MNILVIGNGFDLAHGLPTKYEHFLKFVELFKEFYEKDKKNELDLLKLKNSHDKKNKTDNDIIILSLVNFFNNKYDTGDPTTEDEGKKEHARKIIRELNSIFLDNVWIDYFMSIYEERIENGKDGWIDFESEISRVIQVINSDMRKNNATESTIIKEISVQFFHKYFFEILKRKEEKRNADEFKLFDEKGLCRKELSEFVNNYKKENPVRTLKNKAIYKDLTIRLENDLNKLIRALEIYLTEFLNGIEITRISTDIECLDIDNVLNFNYTSTYDVKYKNCDVEYDYIHGKADINNTIESNNMVLGIDEYLSDDRKNKDVGFIAFKKYYQRIHKQTGCKYKEWVDEMKTEYEEYQRHQKDVYIQFVESIKDGSLIQYPYQKQKYFEQLQEECPIHNLYIFGHSLDVTDKDIFKELILHDNVYTTIFYLNKDVKGQLIANLVKVIGQDELIKRTGGSTKTIEFKLQRDMVEI